VLINKTIAVASTEAHSFSVGQAPPLSTCNFVLKHSAILGAFENTKALQVRFGQFSKLSELGLWNGTVLNVARGMIPVCMEFMHVLLKRPVRSRPVNRSETEQTMHVQRATNGF
jgi:hypothetical protein